MTNGQATRRLEQTGIAGMFLLAFLMSVGFPVFASGDQGDITLQGGLVVKKGPEAALENGGKSVPLTSDRRSISDTLSDSRLSGRELRVVGKFRGDGSFEVHEFFVVHGKSLYRIIYFCEVCNITTFSPGNCACCQNPTLPVEVLPTDPRIYHEEIKGPPKQPGP